MSLIDDRVIKGYMDSAVEEAHQSFYVTQLARPIFLILVAICKILWNLMVFARMEKFDQ